MFFGVKQTYSQCYIDPPPRSDKKIEIRKKRIFGHFYQSTDSCIKMCKVNSKDFSHKWKKQKRFFRDFRFFPILVQL